ncbi:MAG: beta-propeller fold lactonase family protein, partial [Myxococcota bacterium]
MGWKPSARSAAHIACASALFWPALACTSNVLSGALGGGGSDAAPSPDGAVDLGAAPTIDADVAVDAATASDAMVGGDAEVGTDTGSADTGLDSGVDAGMMVDAGTPAGRTFLYIGIAGDAFTDGAWVVMTLDPATGQLTEQSRLVLPAGETGLDGDFPSWGTITSDGRYLLSVREQRGNRPGRLVSYRIDGTTGALTRVDAVDTGRGPVHTAMTSDGSAVLVANIS